MSVTFDEKALHALGITVEKKENEEGELVSVTLRRFRYPYTTQTLFEWKRDVERC